MKIYNKKLLAKWLIYFFSSIITICLFIGFFNYFIDSLWTFNHTNFLNKIQVPFNEREQKTNLLTFNHTNYDTLIIGSSHTSFISQKDFVGYHAFNYAVSAMHPLEYMGYINYAKKQIGRDFKYIVLEVFPIICPDISTDHFFQKNRYCKPEYYVDKSNEYLYRYKNLISYDNTLFSLINVFTQFKPCNVFNAYGARLYDRHNIAWCVKPSKRKIDNYIKQYIDLCHNKNDKISIKDLQNNKIRLLYSQLVDANPHTHFIVFIPPITAPRLIAAVKFENMLPLIDQTIEEAVETFGSVYNFLTLNSISENYYENFKDSHHFLPQVGTLIAHKIIGYPDRNIPADFGILVTKKNLAEHLDYLRRQFDQAQFAKEWR